MPRLRLSAALALLAALAALVAGCGGSSSTTSGRTLESLNAVAERTAAADTARFELALAMTFPGAPEPFAFAVDGAFDSTLKRAQMTIDLSSLMSMLGSLGNAFGGDAQGQLGSPEDWKLEMILDDTIAYVKVPKFAADQVPGGKPWMKGDLKTLASAAGGGLDFGSLGGGDPRDVLKVLEAVSGDLELVGREEQRGVDTTHYRATLDLEKLLEYAAGTQAAAALGGLDEMLRQSGLSAIPVEVWVDDDDLLRRMVMSFSMSQAGQGEAKASIEMDLFDYGEPLFIELPSPDETADVSALVQGS